MRACIKPVIFRTPLLNVNYKLDLEHLGLSIYSWFIKCSRPGSHSAEGIEAETTKFTFTSSHLFIYLFSNVKFQIKTFTQSSNLSKMLPICLEDSLFTFPMPANFNPSFFSNNCVTKGQFHELKVKCKTPPGGIPLNFNSNIPSFFSLGVNSAQHQNNCFLKT